MYSVLLVGLGGALGSMARYAMTLVVGRWWSGAFPLGTLSVNIAGSVLMGMFVGLLARLAPSSAESLRLFLAVGVLGGFTTFSAFSLDTITLLERGAWLEAALYVLLSVAVCLAGLYLGLLMTRGGL